MAVYGGVLLLCAIAYTVLQRTIVSEDEEGNKILAQVVAKDVKGKVSMACYLAAIPLAFVSRWLAAGLFVFVALMWVLPDRRIEKKLVEEEAKRR